MGNIQFKGNKILFTAANKIAMSADCCCGGDTSVCPANCNCNENYSITISGFTGTCDLLNGTFNLIQIGSCSWEHSSTYPIILVTCSESDGNEAAMTVAVQYQLRVADAGYGYHFYDLLCPPGTYTLTGNPLGTCSGQTGTAVIS